MRCCCHPMTDAVGLCSRCGRAGCCACLRDAGAELLCTWCVGATPRQGRDPCGTAFDAVLRRVDNAFRSYHEALRTGAKAELASQVLEAAFAEIARSPLLGRLASAAQDTLQQALDDRLTNPYLTVRAAENLRLVLRAIEDAGDELVGWADDPSFHGQFHLPWKPGLVDRMPPSKIVERMAYVAYLILCASMHAAKATCQLPLTSSVELPVVAEEGDCAPLPTYRTEIEKVRDVRERVRTFGLRLREEARRGRKRIDDAGPGGLAYNPIVLGAVASAIGVLVNDALENCKTLRDLARSPVGQFEQPA
jgi:hypothetical protein